MDCGLDTRRSRYSRFSTIFLMSFFVLMTGRAALAQGVVSLTGRLEQFAQAVRSGDVETVFEMRPPRLVEMLEMDTGEAPLVFEARYKAELAQMLPMEIGFDEHTVADAERLYTTECIHTSVFRTVERREKGTFFRTKLQVVLFKEGNSWYIVGPSSKRENEALDTLCPLWRPTFTLDDRRASDDRRDDP